MKLELRRYIHRRHTYIHALLMATSNSLVSKLRYVGHLRSRSLNLLSTCRELPERRHELKIEQQTMSPKRKAMLFNPNCAMKPQLRGWKYNQTRSTFSMIPISTILIGEAGECLPKMYASCNKQTQHAEMHLAVISGHNAAPTLPRSLRDKMLPCWENRQ